MNIQYTDKKFDAWALKKLVDTKNNLTHNNKQNMYLHKVQFILYSFA